MHYAVRQRKAGSTGKPHVPEIIHVLHLTQH